MLSAVQPVEGARWSGLANTKPTGSALIGSVVTGAVAATEWAEAEWPTAVELLARGLPLPATRLRSNIGLTGEDADADAAAAAACFVRDRRRTSSSSSAVTTSTPATAPPTAAPVLSVGLAGVVCLAAASSPAPLGEATPVTAAVGAYEADDEERAARGEEDAVLNGDSAVPLGPTHVMVALRSEKL